MNRNPYLFIVGCARSGTTLLQRMLDYHPLLAVANEARFMLCIAKSSGGQVDPPLTPELFEWVRGYHRFPKLGLADAVVNEAAVSATTFGDFTSALYSAYGKARGKALAGEKTPRYVRFLPRLKAIFPWVKIIHIIRDGRDVALSVRQWARDDKGPGKFELWNEEPVALCALWWQWQVQAGRVSGAALGPEQYLEVKYEDLVNAPEETLREVTAFLDLPFAPEMLSYHEGKGRIAEGLSAKQAWLPPTCGLRNWRTQMTERDVELFEAIAGGLLSTLGYERALVSVSPPMADLMERCRTRWESEMAGRADYSVPSTGKLSDDRVSSELVF